VKVLITGGAGFVGSSLATEFVKSDPRAKVVVCDNLRRRGSELNLKLFRTLGIQFIHGDIRNYNDLLACGTDFDLFIEASAEPSVHAGMDSDPDYVVETNLAGTFNCLKFARQRASRFLLLSTSRVYSIPALREIAIEETPSRFVIKSEQTLAGVSTSGISENFSTSLFRSFYGATKLSSEYLVEEFAAAYGLNTPIYRCGVIAGPGQFGKTDQGVFTLWVARHYFGLPLEYVGFGGQGKQVRDLLHPRDLYNLIQRHDVTVDQQCRQVYNVGGGPVASISLAELTECCQKVVGKKVPVTSRTETAKVDIPVFICDHRRISAATGWHPTYNAEAIVNDVFEWIRKNEAELRPIFN
jgi:CDP-paratose 2-epimerase